MSDFPVHTIASAPERSRAAMRMLEQAFGFLPNLVGAMSSSPVLVDSLVGLFGKVHGGSFSEAEIQTVLLTDAVANRAAWAIALHTHLARENGVDQHDIEAIRQEAAPATPRLAALSSLARTLIERRGHLEEVEQKAFLAAGYAPEQLLEVIAIVAASTITNYTANVTRPPIEEMFGHVSLDAAQG